MANTYSQLNIQCVFAVQGRQNLIVREFRDKLHGYISGILRNDGCYPLAVGGWKDHVHVFFELPATMSVADEMRMLKATSSKWVNDNQCVRGKFSWQEGYSAFSYSRSQRDEVIRYIIDQEAHHSTRTFREEYLEMMKSFAITYDQRFLFEFYD